MFEPTFGNNLTRRLDKYIWPWNCFVKALCLFFSLCLGLCHVCVGGEGIKMRIITVVSIQHYQAFAFEILIVKYTLERTYLISTYNYVVAGI